MRAFTSLLTAFEDTFLGGCITIKDHGIGMSLERINDLLSLYPSKEAKIGLGLQHAKKYFDEINGRLSIDSEEGVGTTVSISLPYSQTPNWLITSFQIDNRPIIIIDDDKIIHDVWERKVSKLKEIRLLHFTKPEEFIVFCTENKEGGTIFCDYEFLNSHLNGLDLLKQINTSYLKILVTSHYNEESIVKICDENKFKLLPKRLVPYFSIRNQILKNPQEIYLIHIDNDKQCLHSWEYFAKNQNIKIASYSSPQEFLRFQEKFLRDIPIYIDNDLQLEKNGIEYAEEIYKLGFKKIFLSTGSREITIENYPWITKVVDKQAPFIN